MVKLWRLTPRKLPICVVFMPSRQKTKNKTGKEKLLFMNEFLSFGVNLEEDDSVHPRLLCQSFSRNLYRLRSSSPPSELKKCHLYGSHTAKTMKIVFA